MWQVGRFVADECGEDIIEYSLLVAFAAAVSLSVIVSDPFGIKGALIGAYERAKNALDLA